MKNTELAAKSFQVMMQCLLLVPKLKKATKYLHPKLVVKATRIGKFDARMKTVEFKVTVGAPNYQERKFIKLCEKAGEKFPIRKVQLKYGR